MGYSAVIFLTVILGCVLTQSEACSCFPRALQDIYCDTDFAIQAKVISKKRFGGINGDVRYEIKLLKTFRFKKNSGYKTVSKKFIWTGGNSALCGVVLAVGKIYLITGNVHSNRLNMNSCDWQDKWSDLTTFQKKAVKKTWKKQCGKCKIKVCHDCMSCYGVDCGIANVIVPRPPRNTCILNFARPWANCYQEYSVCAKKDGRCNFQQTKSFKKCKKEHSE